ncbi:metal-dependent phosphohydrolase [Planctomycetota bacterium]|nr:metal-dependent phosphohydrolase [Planctomycetota bacterium]
MAQDLFRRFSNQPAPRPTTEPGSKPPGEESGPDKAKVKTAVSEGEVMSAIDKVPPMPAVVQSLLKQMGNQQSSTSDFEDLIRQDMVIAGRLLKLVNSPFYNLSNPVASLSQAVTLCGLSSLRALVLASSTANLMNLDLSAYGFAEKGLWKNSFATAALAKAVAQESKAGPQCEEEWFVAALLRDVGMLVLGPFLAKADIKLRADPDRAEIDILRRERQVLGYDHCWVGERIGERWKLPEPLRLCIARHHRIPTDVSASTMRQLAAVRIAERIGYAAGIGLLKDHPFDAHIDGMLIHAAGLNAESFSQLMKRVPAVVSSSEMPL